MKLLSTTYFVLEQRLTDESLKFMKYSEIHIYINETHDKVYNYAKFMKQPLTLGMFVPCDEKGNILKEPEIPEKFDSSGEACFYAKKSVEYQEAKEKVLFKGFELYGIVKDTASFSTWQFKHNNQIQSVVHSFKHEERSIESLISDFNIEFELTESAIKQIFGDATK